MPGGEPHRRFVDVDDVVHVRRVAARHADCQRQAMVPAGGQDLAVALGQAGDALRMRFRELKLRRDPECPVCGDTPTIRDLQTYDQFCSPAAAHGNTGAGEAQDTEEMTVRELKARMDAGTAPTIVDVREPAEFQICRIPGAKLIPLGQLADRIGELDPSAELVLQCKSGARSARATALLRGRGFSKARNLAGGILAWIDQVDPSQPKY